LAAIDAADKGGHYTDQSTRIDRRPAHPDAYRPELKVHDSGHRRTAGRRARRPISDAPGRGEGKMQCGMSAMLGLGACAALVAKTISEIEEV